MSATAPTLIGLTGPAGSGKDATADVLVKGHGFKKMAFADALRAEVCAAFSVPLDYLTDREAKEIPIRALALAQCYDDKFIDAVEKAVGGLDHLAPRSPRQIMQWWGTEYRRSQSESYWIDRAIKRMGSLLIRRQSVVVTDVRFANEAEALRSMGGAIWQVQRPGLQPVEGRHASAVTGDEFAPDKIVFNAGDLQHLQSLVEVMLGVTA